MVTVYPRPRGEYLRLLWRHHLSYGLPPPTRGIHIRLLKVRVDSGSTPAHAGNTRGEPTRGNLPRVYPRPRGEYGCRAQASSRAGGLPPPTRGIPAAHPPRCTPDRSTPAHAGNTPKYPSTKAGMAVYPRPRGEYGGGALGANTKQGLPPPTRGIRIPFMIGERCPRSTPAHAGNTGGDLKVFVGSGVYPRPRGEYISKTSATITARGLPPPTRGIRAQVAERAAQARSTPAHAGNTPQSQRYQAWTAVYPRPRGEYGAQQICSRALRGLPPPTRGIPALSIFFVIVARSTPAHAGNTASATTAGTATTVYPRPRGEYPRSYTTARSVVGLPPPTRGIPRDYHYLLVRIGSTPAHAGNTAPTFAKPTPLRVYPRPRGEYPRLSPPPPPLSGLPPPTRGIRAAGELAPRVYRSTPAHAGNTISRYGWALASGVYPRPRGEYRGVGGYEGVRQGLPPPTRGIRARAYPRLDAVGSTPAHAGNTVAPPP